MRNKIQKSMMLVICITLLIVFGILTVLFYFNSFNRMKEELKQARRSVDMDVTDEKLEIWKKEYRRIDKCC